MTTQTSTYSYKGGTAPDRSLRQRLDALDRANDVRVQRAKLKERLKRGAVSVHDIILDTPEYVENMKLFNLLMAAPKYGRVKVNKILNQLRISPSKTVGGLSDRQRSEIIKYLRSR